MEFQEALEYLNLPASCSRQLVRKRYLELKKDYLKAINNAPSDHFSALYRENLDKIEEAYNLLIETADIVQDPDNDIQNCIRKSEEIVASFLKNGTKLTPKKREEIKQYINEINRMQDQLRVENQIKQRAKITLPSERWELSAKTKLKQKLSSPQNLGKPEGESLRKWHWELKSLGKKRGATLKS